MLKAENLSLSYQDGRTRRLIFSNVSLTVEEGDFVAILGPSGSGKSSLLYILSTLRAADSGRVSVNDLVTPDTKKTS